MGRLWKRPSDRCRSSRHPDRQTSDRPRQIGWLRGDRLRDSPGARGIWSRVGGTIAVVGLLAGCGSSYPRALNFPFNPAGGRGLNGTASELMPSISGRYVTFVSDRNGSQDVYLFDAEAGQMLDLPGLNALDAIASHPSVSEDGRYIAYAASLRGQSDIFVYDRSTGLKRNLTNDLQAEVRHPSISADGSRVAFEASPDGRWDVFVRDRSGRPIAP